VERGRTVGGGERKRRRTAVFTEKGGNMGRKCKGRIVKSGSDSKRRQNFL